MVKLSFWNDKWLLNEINLIPRLINYDMFVSPLCKLNG
jgi:hypothetical protein